MILPRGFEDLLKEKEKLSEKDKDFLKKALDGIEKYLENQRKSSINGWYLYAQENSIRHLGDTEYMAEHLPTERFISFGTEYDGLNNIIRFFKTITYDTILTDEQYNLNLKNLHLDRERCYNCVNYLKDGDYHFKCHLLQGYDPHKHNQLMEIHKYRDAESCPYYRPYELDSPIEYKDYDNIPIDWHKKNSVNEWSLFIQHNIEYGYRINSMTMEKHPIIIDLCLAKHLPTKEVIYLGFNNKYNDNGLRNSIEFFKAIIGEKDHTRIGECLGCQHYTNKDSVCKLNHIMRGKCDDYERGD